MNYTIDASVFVSSMRHEEEGFSISRELVHQFEQHALNAFCPVLILPECAAAVTRATDDRTSANEIVTLLENMTGLYFVALDIDLAKSAARIAAEQRLRGADAIYVAVAQAFDAKLITWDTEMLERGARVVQTMTPARWLEQNKASQEKE